MYQEKIRETRAELNELNKAQDDYEKVLGVLIEDDLSKLPISNFLNVVEKAFESRVKENPMSPNELEISKVYKLLKYGI